MTCEWLEKNRVVQFALRFGPSKLWPLENHWQLRLQWWWQGLIIELNPSPHEIERAHAQRAKKTP